MKSLLGMLVVVMGCAVARGGYDYVVESGYGFLPSLEDSETLLMTGGGGSLLDMADQSFARIEGTSALEQDHGGIWSLEVFGESHLEFLGGEVHELGVGTYGSAVLYGGKFDQIRSAQNAWKYDGDPPVLVANPHITIVCDLDSINYDIQTKNLTGNWLDGTAFNIQLIDVGGFSPTIDNIQFIPEPATLLLLGAGVMLIRKRR